MWDEDDSFGRWFQGICAIFLAAFAMALGYYIYTSTFFFGKMGEIALLIASVGLCWRCARYAVTGNGNVNRDDY
jgi:hypothetical protein